jgi:hypothetical protein
MSHIKALRQKSGASAAATAAAAAQAAARSASVGGGTFMPAPLLLDEQGREIDAAGKVVAEKPTVAPVATLKANQGGARRSETAKKNQNPYLSHRSVDEEDKLETFDPRLKVTKRETYVLLDEKVGILVKRWLTRCVRAAVTVALARRSTSSPRGLT